MNTTFTHYCKYFTIAISLLMLFVFNQSVSAQTATAPAAGTGTIGDPYQIATLNNLYWIAALDGVVSSPNRAVRWAANYIQTANIDASPTSGWFSPFNLGFLPIGTSTNTGPFSATNAGNIPFSGTYDGGGHKISDLTINRSGKGYIGLFGLVIGGVVKNLGLPGITVSGFQYTGSFIGAGANAQLQNVFSSGSITSPLRDVGGLVGFMRGSTISNSYTHCTVNGTAFVGGIVGYIDAAASSGDGVSSISNSFSTGAVSVGSGGVFVGGIAGYFQKTILTNCYNTGAVFGDIFVGGIIGSMVNGSSSSPSVVENSYNVGPVSGGSSVGGLVGLIGSSNAFIFNGFYDSETSGQIDNTGKGVPKTTVQMKTQSTFTSSNFTTNWRINPTGFISYPYLRAFTYDVPNASPAVNPIPGLVASITEFVWNGATADGGTAGNWTGGLPPVGADIRIPGTATTFPVFAADLQLGTVTIEANATMTMDPSFRLDLTPGSSVTVAAGGKLILKSDGTGTAYIGSLAGGSAITGTVLQERYLMGSNRSFRFMSHPFSSGIPLSVLGDKIDITGSGTGFTPTDTNDPSAFYYDPATGDADADADGGWTAFTAITDTWTRYQGIRVLVRGPKGQAGSFLDIEYTPDPVTFEWEGQVNTGTQTIPLAFHSPSGGVSDFNLIGNPYPSAIDLKAITRSASVGTSFFVWQPRESTSGSSGRGGAYLTEPFATGAATYTLPTGGAFFVRSGAASQSITIEEADKVNSNETLQSVVGSTLRMDTEQASKYGSNSLQLVLSSNGEWWDRSLVFFDANDTGNSQDPQDATKLANPEVNFFTVSADDYAMAIDSRPYQEANDQSDANRIPLHILSPARTYTLSLPDFDIAEGQTLRLYDRFTQKYIDLAKGTSYDFAVTENPNSKGHRFDLVMGIEVITSLAVGSSRFQAFLLPNPAQEQVRISIQAPDNVAETRVRIVSIAGVEIRNERLAANSSELDVNLGQLSKGIYLVEITHGTERIVKRLIVN